MLWGILCSWIIIHSGLYSAFSSNTPQCVWLVRHWDLDAPFIWIFLFLMIITIKSNKLRGTSNSKIKLVPESDQRRPPAGLMLHKSKEPCCSGRRRRVDLTQSAELSWIDSRKKGQTDRWKLSDKFPPWAVERRLCGASMTASGGILEEHPGWKCDCGVMRRVGEWGNLFKVMESDRAGRKGSVGEQRLKKNYRQIWIFSSQCWPVFQMYRGDNSNWLQRTVGLCIYPGHRNSIWFPSLL